MELVQSRRRFQNHCASCEGGYYLDQGGHHLDPAVLSGGNDASVTNLQACIGECDADSQCASGLKCFQRAGHTAVPGCAGSGVAGWDYCYKPLPATASATCKPYQGTCPNGAMPSQAKRQQWNHCDSCSAGFRRVEPYQDCTKEYASTPGELHSVPAAPRPRAAKPRATGPAEQQLRMGPRVGSGRVAPTSFP